MINPSNIQELVGQEIVKYMQYRDDEVDKLKRKVAIYEEDMVGRRCIQVGIAHPMTLPVEGECSICGHFLNCGSCDKRVRTCCLCKKQICKDCAYVCSSWGCVLKMCLLCCGAESCYECFCFGAHEMPCPEHGKLEQVTLPSGSTVKICSQCRARPIEIDNAQEAEQAVTEWKEDMQKKRKRAGL